MSDLHISWDEYHHSIELLADKITYSGSEFDRVICLARGGLRVGDILSRIFHLPLGILATSSYSSNCERGQLAIANHLTTVGDHLGRRILLVDDLVDSGVTLQQTIPWLRKHYPEIQDLQTAVLWYKAHSICVPDYYVSYLADNPWIHQPFEKYDR